MRPPRACVLARPAPPSPAVGSAGTCRQQSGPREQEAGPRRQLSLILRGPRPPPSWVQGHRRKIVKMCAKGTAQGGSSQDAQEGRGATPPPQGPRDGGRVLGAQGREPLSEPRRPCRPTAPQGESRSASPPPPPGSAWRGPFLRRGHCRPARDGPGPEAAATRSCIPGAGACAPRCWVCPARVCAHPCVCKRLTPSQGTVQRVSAAACVRGSPRRSPG